MIKSLNAISLFCEDVREEVGGQYSIVGILPDGILVSGFPGAIPKLGIYTRVSFDPREEFDELTILLRREGSEDQIIGQFDKSIAATAVGNSEDSRPVAGLFSYWVTAPFPVKSAGVISVVLSDGKTERTVGFVRIASELHEAL